jgi:hypothetical protein
MANLKIIQDVATKIGIDYTTGQKTVYTIKDDYPIQFLEGSDGNTPVLLGVIRFDEGNKDKLIKDTLLQDKSVMQTGLKSKSIEIKDGIITLKWTKGLLGYPKPEKIAEQFLSVFNTIKSMTGRPGLKCRVCASKDISGPILINGIVDRMCPKCIENLKKEVEDVKAAYEALPVNFPLAIIAAIVLAIVGAGLWAGVIAATHKMYWMIAIFVGLAIGWVTAKAAGKGGLPVQIIGFSATFISVLLGMIFYVGYVMHDEAVKVGQSVDWGALVQDIPSILMQAKGDVAFSLVGGLVGAFYAALKAGKPELSVKVEK